MDQRGLDPHLRNCLVNLTADHEHDYTDSEEDSDDVVDSDEDDRDPSGSRSASQRGKPWLPTGKPKCQYGRKCIRKNPNHFREESHPQDHPMAVPLATPAPGGGSKKDDDVWFPADKTRCKYGLMCRRQNPTHFQDEGHPSQHTSPHIPRTSIPPAPGPLSFSCTD